MRHSAALGVSWGQLTRLCNGTECYNQADTVYQMLFAQWQAEQSDENAQAPDEAWKKRSQAEIARREGRKLMRIRRPAK